VLAFCAAGSGSDGDRFVVEKLVIGGRDCTATQGRVDLANPRGSTGSTEVEIHFRAPAAGTFDPTRLVLHHHSTLSRLGRPRFGETFRWSGDCRYDPTSRHGVFRISRLRYRRPLGYDACLDASRALSPPPSEPVYWFHLAAYPSLPDLGLGSLPLYGIEGHLPVPLMGWSPSVYCQMNRHVPPNTSLAFTVTPHSRLWPKYGPLAAHLRVLLVKMDETDDAKAFRPWRMPDDLPGGEETVLFDGRARGGHDQFVLKERTSVSGTHWFWIYNPNPGCAVGGQDPRVFQGILTSGCRVFTTNSVWT